MKSDRQKHCSILAICSVIFQTTSIQFILKTVWLVIDRVFVDHKEGVFLAVVERRVQRDIPACEILESAEFRLQDVEQVHVV